MDINILMTRKFHLDTMHWIGAMQPFDPPRASSWMNPEEKKSQALIKQRRFYVSKSSHLFYQIVGGREIGIDVRLHCKLIQSQQFDGSRGSSFSVRKCEVLERSMTQ